jgi:hypothetical protein
MVVLLLPQEVDASLQLEGVCLYSVKNLVLCNMQSSRKFVRSYLWLGQGCLG